MILPINILMDDLIICSICLDSFDSDKKTPLSLICGHTFCKACLLLIEKKTGILCPNDKTKDPRNLNLIPKNYSLLDIINLINTSKKVGVSEILYEKNKSIEDCNEYLMQLEQLKSISEEEQARTLKELEKGFNIIRESLSYRESELMKNIQSTHENIQERITALNACIVSIKSEFEFQLAELNNIKKSQGDVQIELQKYSKPLTFPSKLEELKEIVNKLPIQVLISPKQFDNCIQSFAKVIDDTQSRVSNLNAVFVADIRVQDGDKFMPSSTFVKTWRLRNEGIQEWPNSCWCVFSHGSFRGDSVVIDPAWPGEDVDVSVVLSAPSELGNHFSYWKLVDPNGLTFGPILWANIEVYNID
jgi:predicted transcriptional regulator